MDRDTFFNNTCNKLFENLLDYEMTKDDFSTYLDENKGKINILIAHPIYIYNKLLDIYVYGNDYIISGKSLKSNDKYKRAKKLLFDHLADNLRLGMSTNESEILIINKLNVIIDKNMEIYHYLKIFSCFIVINDPYDKDNHVLASNNINKIQADIKSQSKEIKDLHTTLNNQDKDIVNKIKSNIYTDFIAILGIFTAITFAIFGGMNLLSNLFKHIGSTKTSLGQTLILTAVFGIVMWGIIELLFYWVSKIKVSDEKQTQKRNWHRIFLIGLFVGVLAAILGVGVWLFLSGIK